MIRSFDSGIPVARVMAVRRTWGICVEVHIVNCPEAEFGSTRIDRGSIALGICLCTR